MGPSVSTAIVGGCLIGAAAVWLYLCLGRIAGISGIAARVLTKPTEQAWPAFFLVGLGAGGWIARWLVNAPPVVNWQALASSELKTLLGLVIGGLLVGFGTRLGSGCTSGHGVCGLARFSPRSITATVCFVAVGMLTATGVASL